MGIPRILEPEVMDTAQDALEYDAMDFSEVNLSFAFRAVELAPPEGTVLDIGTGTARIPILILQNTDLPLRIHGVDLSSEMLKVAERNVSAAGFDTRIALTQVDAKSLPFEDGSFDMVVSNSLVHHIPNPLDFFSEVARIVRPGGGVFLRDLFRPVSTEMLETLVATYAGNEDAYQQKLFRDSLHAALTIAEVREMIVDAGLQDMTVLQSSDRHWSVERATRL